MNLTQTITACALLGAAFFSDGTYNTYTYDHGKRGVKNTPDIP